MNKAFAVSIISFGFTLALSASPNNNGVPIAEQLKLDDLYVCFFWPTCRDPDEHKPGPSDSSAPKPGSDKDTTKDKKNEAQLA